MSSGRPRDRAAAIEALRTAVELGVNHIDTADASGPYITNEIIRESAFPYGDDVHHRAQGPGGPRRAGRLGPRQLTSSRCAEQVHDNLGRLGLDVLDVRQPPDPRRD